MREVAMYVVTTLIGGGVGWWFSKLLTKREKKATDLELFEKAVTPLLTSIGNLTTHISETTEKYAAEQKKTLHLMQEKSAWLEEKATLTRKVESLEQKVMSLTRLVKKLADEKDVGDIVSGG